MAGLVEFPSVETAPGELLWPRSLQAEFAEGEEVARVRHAITRHRIQARVVEARLLRPVAEGELADARGARWLYASPERLGQLALTGMARKVCALLH
jgi:hypothetical protein